MADDKTNEEPWGDGRVPKLTQEPNPAVYDAEKSCVRIRLANGFDAIVDAEDYHRVRPYRWHSRGGVAAAEDPKSIPIYLHRWILGAKRNKNVMFASGDTYDCRKQNLIYQDGTHTRNPRPAHLRPGTRGYAMSTNRYALRGIRERGFCDRVDPKTGEVTQRGMGPRPLVLIERDDDENSGED